MRRGRADAAGWRRSNRAFWATSAPGASLAGGSEDAKEPRDARRWGGRSFVHAIEMLTTALAPSEATSATSERIYKQGAIRGTCASDAALTR